MYVRRLQSYCPCGHCRRISWQWSPSEQSPNSLKRILTNNISPESFHPHPTRNACQSYLCSAYKSSERLDFVKRTLPREVQPACDFSKLLALSPYHALKTVHNCRTTSLRFPRIINLKPPKATKRLKQVASSHVVIAHIGSICWLC